MQAMTHAFFDVGLERMVGRDAGRGIGLRLGGITDVGNAQIDVSAFKSLQVGLTVGKGRAVRKCWGSSNRIAISIVLLNRTSPSGWGWVGEAICA